MPEGRNNKPYWIFIGLCYLALAFGVWRLGDHQKDKLKVSPAQVFGEVQELKKEIKALRVEVRGLREALSDP